MVERWLEVENEKRKKREREKEGENEGKEEETAEEEVVHADNARAQGPLEVLLLLLPKALSNEV